MRSIGGGALAGLGRGGLALAWVAWATSGCLLLSPGDYACRQDADCVFPFRCNTATGTCETRLTDGGAPPSSGPSSGTGSTSSTPSSTSASAASSSGTSALASSAAGSTGGPSSSVSWASSSGASGDGSSSFTGVSTSGSGSSQASSRGPCLGCANAQQCPVPDNACLQAECDAENCCGTVPKAESTPTVQGQTLGDCRVVVCDGQGGTRQAEDPLDLPQSAPECLRSPACGGVPLRPVYLAEEAGVLCSGGVCGNAEAAGTCVQCNVNADCPATGNACLAAVCTRHMCDVSPRTGEAVGTQVPGDCQRVVCTRTGGQMSVDDPNDVPLTSPECQQDPTCAGSPLAPSHGAADPGIPCSGGRICGADDAAGICVECNAWQDCPPTGNECVARICEANRCGTINLGAETALAVQQGGDCQRLVCNGMAGSRSVDDAMDLPTPASVCQTMPACSGIPLAPAFTPAATSVMCAASTLVGRCGEGAAAGQCVECNVDMDCTVGGCVNNACQ